MERRETDMVYSTYFTYDGVFSAQYGLQIAEFNGLVPQSVEENEAFSPTLSVLKAPSLRRFYHGGISYEDTPTCEISVVSEAVIQPWVRREILSWLVGRNEFKPLQFHSDNYKGFTYYCVFTNASIIYINGECHGFKLTANFDSPFARGEPTIVETTSGTHTVTIMNKSDIRDGYIYPTVQFQGASLSIINSTDSATRAFTFSDLENDETVIVDCETHIIKSNKSGEKYSKFTSKNWLQLRPGVNSLSITSAGNVRVTCPWYAMIGF
jgi:phage-related protein